MPQGKGTYGSKVGRPHKKKKIDPVKKKKAKGPKLKGGGEVLTSGSAKSVAALRKAALLKAKKKGVKKPMKPAVKAKRGSSSTKRKSLKY